VEVGADDHRKGFGFFDLRSVWVLSLLWCLFCLRRLFVGLPAALACLPAALVGVLTALAFPCILIGLLASPLCGAALTFFAAAKKVSKESGLTTASS
jgi:hypothetical protein